MDLHHALQQTLPQPKSNCPALSCLLLHPLCVKLMNHSSCRLLPSNRKHHLSYDHRFLRNHRARALGDSLKLGFSDCQTLAWLDVLSLQVSWRGAGLVWFVPNSHGGAVRAMRGSCVPDNLTSNHPSESSL